MCSGLERGKFENKDVTYQHHIDHDHKVWNYLFFIVHLKMKSTTEFTGPESYVYEKIKGVRVCVCVHVPLNLLCGSLSTCHAGSPQPVMQGSCTLLSLQGKIPDLEWFPRLRCMSLDTEDSPEQEQNEIKELQRNLVATNAIVKTLSLQLNELKDKVGSLAGGGGVVLPPWTLGGSRC